MPIKITDVKIFKTKSEKSKTKAFAKVVIDDGICIDGIRVIDGVKGLFIGMPSRKRSDSDEYDDIVFPINKDTRQLLTDTILEAFKKEGGTSSESGESKEDIWGK